MTHYFWSANACQELINIRCRSANLIIDVSPLPRRRTDALTRYRNSLLDTPPPRSYLILRLLSCRRSFLRFATLSTWRFDLITSVNGKEDLRQLVDILKSGANVDTGNRLEIPLHIRRHCSAYVNVPSFKSANFTEHSNKHPGTIALPPRSHPCVPAVDHQTSWIMGGIARYRGDGTDIR